MPKIKNEKLKYLPLLILTFLKIGAFTFGGGYAMIPIIQNEIVEKKKWISEDDLLDIIAIAESTPGPIAINTATFIGYKVCGTLGSVCATLSVILPSFLIILIISFILNQFQNLKTVKYAFNGIRAGVLALIIKAWISMYKKCPKDVIFYVIAVLALIFAAFLKVNVLLITAACAVIGVAYSLITVGREKK